MGIAFWSLIQDIYTSMFSTCSWMPRRNPALPNLLSDNSPKYTETLFAWLCSSHYQCDPNDCLCRSLGLEWNFNTMAQLPVHEKHIRPPQYCLGYWGGLYVCLLSTGCPEDLSPLHLQFPLCILSHKTFLCHFFLILETTLIPSLIYSTTSLKPITWS